MRRKILKWFSPLLALAIFLLALWTLKRALGSYRFSDIVEQLGRLPPESIAGALMLSVASYLLLTLYDHLALHYLGRRLPVTRVTLASFSSYAFSHNVGFSLLTGGSIRYRMYSSWGLSAEEVARLTAFAALSFVLGMTTVGSLLLLISPADLPHFPYLPLKSLWPLAAIGLAAVASYLLLVFFRRQPVGLRGWQVPLPPFRHGIGQILLGSVEWAVTASVLYPLLPPGAGLSLPEFLQIYLLAQLVAMFSHVPGGLGVFETVFLWLVPEVPPPALFSTLLVFRSIYYLLPFGLAILLLAIFEAMQQRKKARRAGAAIGQWIAAAGPLLLAAGTLGAGAVLLFSAVIPRDTEQLPQLAAWLPHSLREIGHFLSAVTGAGLLLVARGLQLRLRSAWQFATVLLPAGLLFALMGGSGTVAAGVCGVVLAALLPSRDLIHRPLSLRDETFTPWWITLILIIHSTAVWLGLFSLPEAGFPSAGMRDLSTEAARILRAEAGSALVLLAFVAAKRLRPFTFVPTADPEDMAHATTLAAKDRASISHLVWLGDKKLLFSPTQDAFLMYAESGSCLVSLGEPIGSAAQRQELAWRFREICERQGKSPVFFAIGENSPACLEMGLALQPIGREGTIPLFEFSPAELDSGVGEHCRAVQENGCRFEVVDASAVPEILPELANIAGERQTTGEKVGQPLVQDYFQSAFIGRFPVAVVQRAGAILAFASLPPANEGADLILGLVRTLPAEPPGIAEFLLVNLCLWGREAGLSRLNLGIVPTVGEAGDPLTGTWQRFGPRIFPHGELFATLRELRAFKESFRPRWHSPLYLACPETLALPEILADIAGMRERRRGG